MTDILQYKDFLGTVHYSDKDEVFYGKLEGVNDLVTFEGSSVKALKVAFKAAVDDYIFLCKESGKEVLKSFKGSFNVRIKPALHAKIYKKATLQGKSLNQFIQDTLERNMAHE